MNTVQPHQELNNGILQEDRGTRERIFKWIIDRFKGWLLGRKCFSSVFLSFLLKCVWEGVGGYDASGPEYLEGNYSGDSLRKQDFSVE